jgi:hypothetical protein
MKKPFMCLLLCLASCLMLMGCQRDRGVYAGNDDYQPRPAPPVAQQPKQDIEGELVRVNIPAKTFVVRVENGMEQTFKFDDSTEVMGLDDGRSHVRDLVGKEGSEITVQSDEDGETRMAKRVDVTQLSTAKAKSPRRRKR